MDWGVVIRPGAGGNTESEQVPARTKSRAVANSQSSQSPDGPTSDITTSPVRALVLGDAANSLLPNASLRCRPVAFASTIGEVVALAQRLRPDVILADVSCCPDGFDWLRQARRHAALDGTPVILVADRQSEERAVAGLLAGADDYLVRPFSPQELDTRVTARLELARARRQAEGFNYPRAGEDLPEADSRYRSMFQAIDEGFCVVELLFDEHDQPYDLRFLEANPAFERHSGITDPLGKRLGDIAPVYGSDWRETLGKVAVTGQPIRFEVRAVALNRCLDVYAFRVDDPAARHVALLFSDITARKAMEGALRQSEANLTAELAAVKKLQDISSRLIHENDINAIYEQVVDAAMALLGSDTGSMQMLNTETNQLALLVARGFAEETATFFRWVGPDTASTCGVALREGVRIIMEDIDACDYMAGTEGKVAFGYSGIRAMQSTPLISRSGRLVGMISTHWRRPHRPSERELRLLDVLARQAADLIERTQTMDRLTELDRIKTEFISNISHELCTPLASVLGYIELLDSGMAGELTPTQKELLEIAYESGCSLQVLIEELLDVSRMESGRFRLALEAVNLAEMAERALIRVAPQAEAKHLTITRHLSPDVPLLLADARRMQQVFSNLLGNAIKFTSEGGRVDLWVGSQNGSVVVEVADTGPGIHPDDLPRLFDRFHRGRGTGCVPGTGLGLYLIKTIVESHGGTVEVESELGAGSRFRVRLPVR